MPDLSKYQPFIPSVVPIPLPVPTSSASTRPPNPNPEDTFREQGQTAGTIAGALAGYYLGKRDPFIGLVSAFVGQYLGEVIGVGLYKAKLDAEKQQEIANASLQDAATKLGKLEPISKSINDKLTALEKLVGQLELEAKSGQAKPEDIATIKRKGLPGLTAVQSDAEAAIRSLQKFKNQMEKKSRDETLTEADRKMALERLASAKELESKAREQLNRSNALEARVGGL